MTTTNAATLVHSIGTHGRLEVRVASWDVEIVGVDGDEVRIRNADGGSLPRLDVERGAGSLRVAQPAHGIVISFGNSIEVRLAIEVPSQARVAAQSANGDIEVRGLHADQQIRTASGEVRLHDAAGDVVVESVSGDVAVELDGTAAVGVKSVAGDVSIGGGRVERLALTTTSGDIRVASDLGAGPHTISTLSGDAALATGSGVRVTARTLSGDISSDLPHSSEGGPGRRAMTIGDGSTVVEFKSVSGDLRVFGRDPDDARAFTWELPVPPAPTAPPIAPEPPGAPAAPGDPAEASPLETLQALERGEIDVAEAGQRLARLEGSSDD